LVRRLGGKAEWYRNETPQHEVHLPTFRISRYPVTNAQYAAFVRDGGYTERWRRCWTREGWEWKGDRKGPETYGGAFGLPNHPVVGVTWYEAVAFCRWLTEKLRVANSEWRGDVREPQTSASSAEPSNEAVRLPTEAEWEKAASWEGRGERGERREGRKRRYPWGDEPDPNRANYDETGIGATSAVGMFPAGSSPFGALDMAGNVWEWCATRWQGEYPLPQEDEWSDRYVGGDARRVLRGGAFYNSVDRVRCAYRHGVNPDFRSGNRAFRIVVSPISPPSAL
jgi:formylglycine-generating enzyme required for sulfatase activity